MSACLKRRVFSMTSTVNRISEIIIASKVRGENELKYFPARLKSQISY